MTWIRGQIIPLAQHLIGRTAAWRGSELLTDERFGWRGPRFQTVRLAISSWKCAAYEGTIGRDVAFVQACQRTTPVNGWTADEHGLDTEQGDAVAGAGGICGGESIWARSVGEPDGSGADSGVDRTRCAGRTHRANKEAGDSHGSADRHFGRPDDRERVLHLFRGRGDGVAVAACVFLRARGGDGFSSRPGRARRAFRMGREHDAADLVGTGAGGFAVEPRTVCGDEMLVFLLFGVGTGAREGSRRAARCVGGGCSDAD